MGVSIENKFLHELKIPVAIFAFSHYSISKIEDIPSLFSQQ